MAKEFVISTSRINCYGTRVLTDGGDLEQFKKNPVLLYMHRRALYGEETMVIGRVENIRIDGDRLIGTPVFDLADEFAAKIGRKWDDDFLRMCSAGIEIIELSSAPEHLLPGQTRETITKWKLVEVSIVDIGANDDALKLYESGGKVLQLAAGAESDLLPLLKPEPTPEAAPVPGSSKNDNQQINFSMEKILLALGLAATATEADALAAITQLQDDAKRSETLELARVESAVDTAIAANKLTADKREKFVSLGKSAGFEHLQTALEALTPVVKPTQFINPGSTVTASSTSAAPTYDQMSEAQLAKLQAENPEEFARVYEAFFGYAPGSMK